MTKIVLLGAAPVGGEMRYPSEGSISVSAEEAEALIKVGLAEPDNLATKKVDELRRQAVAGNLDVGPAATKPELVTALRDARSGEA